MTRVLVVAAHPDDAELAVGGTLALLADRGAEVTVALATVSEFRTDLRPLRRAAAEEAAGIIGHRIRWMAEGHYDQVEQLPDYRLVELVDAVVEEIDPAVVITHWEGDSHGDHVRLARSVLASSRRWPGTGLVQFGPNEYRTPLHGEFTANLYVPITEQLERKKKALRCYRYPGQGFRAPDEDAVDLLARTHGLAVGVSAAEALLIRRIRWNSALPGLV
ncbi:PIG-L deacetylase family protein [Streptomyces eurythermus]